MKIGTFHVNYKLKFSMLITVPSALKLTWKLKF